MADLVTRLRLDSKQFDDNIKKSKQQLDGFKSSGSSINGGISSLLMSIKGVATGIGVATAAMTVFNTSVNSSASSQENLTIKINTAKTSVNEFFNSLKSGDWSFFKNGIIDAINLAGDYAVAMKIIKEGTPLLNTYKDDKDAKLDHYNNIIENPNSTAAEKERAWKQYKKIYGNQESITTQAENELENKIKTIVSKAGITLNGDKDYENLKKASTATASGLTYSSTLYKRYEDLLEGESILGMRPMGLKGMGIPIDEKSFFANEKKLGYSDTYEGKHSEWAQKRINAVNEVKAIEAMHPDVMMLYKMKKHLNEDEMKAINEADSALSGLRSNLETRTTEYNQLNTKFDKDGKIIKEKPKDEGLSPEQLLEIQNDNWINMEMKGFHDKLKRAAYGLDPIPITYQPTIIEEEDPEELPLPEAPKETKKELKELAGTNFDSTIEGLNGIASLLGSITNLTNEGASAWISYAANVISAIGMAIPALSSLIGLKRQDVLANTAEAATGAAASQASIPIVGPIMAVAAIASILAAIASIPAFANGGIFESSLTTGDRNIARLNGGEMILNKGQQYNLFKLLDNGSPISNGGNVTFKIQGRELVGVLNNYNNKINRVM